MGGQLRLFDIGQLSELAQSAAGLPRLRTNLNIHSSLDDPIQRMFNVMQPGAYFRAHRHDGERWELFIALSGRIAVLLFDEHARVVERAEVGPASGNLVVEIPPRVWHTLVVLEPDTILVELKPGPYQPLSDKDFAPWAPAEDDPSSADFEHRLHDLQPGEGWQ